MIGSQYMINETPNLEEIINSTINETQFAAVMNKHTNENVNFDPNKNLGTTRFINFRPIVSSKRRISFFDMHLR